MITILQGIDKRLGRLPPVLPGGVETWNGADPSCLATRPAEEWGLGKRVPVRGVAWIIIARIVLTGSGGVATFTVQYISIQ
jgi:hypothetical protein